MDDNTNLCYNSAIPGLIDSDSGSDDTSIVNRKKYADPDGSINIQIAGPFPADSSSIENVIYRVYIDKDTSREKFTVFTKDSVVDKTYSNDVDISLDSPYEKEHNENRGGDVYKYAIEALEICKEYGIESGIINCIVHEKKNFSHGRFINYEHLSTKKNIYFKSKNTSLYESKLLEYLKDDQNIIIESKYYGLLCEYDLLIASQYLMYYIANFLDIDISKPTYSEENDMKLFFYKGKLWYNKLKKCHY